MSIARYVTKKAKTLVQLSFVAALSAVLPACALGGRQSEDFAQRFVDAETGLPIAGVFVNVVWIKEIPGKVESECVQTATLRSDADGWARQSAPKDRKAFQRVLPKLLAPGYEYFVFVPEEANSGKITVRHRISFRPGYRDRFPAWVSSIEALGYIIRGDFYEKQFVIEDFGTIQERPRYLIKRRSFPEEMVLATRSVTEICPAPGINIGTELHEEAREVQISQYVKMLCDSRWDTATSIDENFFMGAINALDKNDGGNAWLVFKDQFPGYPANRIRPLNTSERIRFCSLVEKHVKE